MLGKIQIPSLIRQQHSCKPIVFSARDFFVFGKIQKGHLNDFLCRINIIPDLLFVGFEKKAKGRVEDYSAATSGFFLAQPTGLVRFSGI